MHGLRVGRTDAVSACSRLLDVTAACRRADAVVLQRDAAAGVIRCLDENSVREPNSNAASVIAVLN